MKNQGDSTHSEPSATGAPLNKEERARILNSLNSGELKTNARLSQEEKAKVLKRFNKGLSNIEKEREKILDGVTDILSKPENKETGLELSVLHNFHAKCLRGIMHICFSIREGRDATVDEYEELIDLAERETEEAFYKCAWVSNRKKYTA